MRLTIEGVRDTPEIEDVINTFPARDLAMIGTEPPPSRRKHKKRDSRRVCPICGEQFMPAPLHMYKVECPTRLLSVLAPGVKASANRWVYLCGYNCWRAAQKMIEETGSRSVTCPVCGVVFRTIDKRKVYCSPQCTNAAGQLARRGKPSS